MPLKRGVTCLPSRRYTDKENTALYIADSTKSQVTDSKTVLKVVKGLADPGRD